LEHGARLELSVMTMPSELNGNEVEGEVGRRAGYRRHSLEFKERVVAEYDALPEYGGHRGSMLRRENLRRNQISVWRRELAGEAIPASGRRPKRTAEQVELDRLRKANAKLQRDLDRTRLALEITGKAHALLEMLSESAASDTAPPR